MKISLLIEAMEAMNEAAHELRCNNLSIHEQIALAGRVQTAALHLQFALEDECQIEIKIEREPSKFAVAMPK